MQVGYNPTVNFRSNLIESMIKGQTTVDNTSSNPQNNGLGVVTEDTVVLQEIKHEKDIESFKEALKSRNWEKKYLPESDVIWIKQKRVKDGEEYCLEKDGTVKKTAPQLGTSEVLMETNRQMSEEFNKIKSKHTNPKPSLWYRIKDATADTWKFFSATATMLKASGKGLLYGTLTAATTLAGAAIVKAPKAIKSGETLLNVIKHPMKTAGLSGKLLALAAGTAILVTHIVKGKLAANQNTAVIEHKMNVDHRQKQI